MDTRSLFFIAVLVPFTTFSAEPETVAPGSVVHWGGAEILECAAFGERWQPVDGTCWYPIDLLHEEEMITLTRSTSAGTEHSEVLVGPYTYPVQELTVAPGMVDLSDENRARAAGESARMMGIFKRRGPAMFHLPLGPPLEKMPKARSFGSRRVFNGQPRSPHSGADYSAVTGTPILAVDQGTVVLAEALFFAGNAVIVDHGGGLISMSMHLNSIDVEVGQEVLRGQLLGTVGATGRVTGAHLHFALRWLGARVDPTPLLERGKH